jgi:hypothetical protein
MIHAPESLRAGTLAMRRKHISSVIAAAAIAVSAGNAANAQARLDAAYSVYLTGIPIGRGAIVLDITETGFAAAGSAKSTGLVRIVSKGDGTASVRGTFMNSRVLSSIFSLQSNSGGQSEQIDVTINNGVAQDFRVTPEKPEHSQGPRVPVTSALRKGVLDPMSAGLIIVPGTGDTLQPDSCNHTLPIFDARYRYNFVLSYLRTENAPKKINGYAGPVLVCQVREPRPLRLARACRRNARAGPDQGFDLDAGRHHGRGSDAFSR